MAERILVKGSFLWDGTSNKLSSEDAVIIKDNKILAIDKFLNFSPLSYDRILDFPGTTLMPGMIDCHTHHSLDASLENFLDRMSDSIPVLTARAIATMKKDLVSGVTVIRTLGDKEYLDIFCRDAVNSGSASGPRSLVAGKGIRSAGGHGFVGYPFTGKEEILNAINENLNAGADLIKIYITGTLKGKGDLPSFLSREEIETAIKASHEAGLKIAAHCVGGSGLDMALEYGLDTLEHAYHISDRQIRKLAESETFPILTLSPVLNDEIVKHYPDHLIQGHFDEREEISGRIRALIGEGISFALGTDGMHGKLAQEAEYAVALGAETSEVLKALTINGAKVCGIESETGSLVTGKYADMIVIDGNPFNNIASLKNVKAVFRQGRIVPDINIGSNTKD